MKEFFSKKFFNMTFLNLFFLMLGLFLAVGATIVYATWNEAKTGGSGQLSEANWNAMVDQLGDTGGSLTANNGMYSNRIILMTPPAAYTEICFKSGSTYYDAHASSESTASGNCVPGDVGYIIEKNERTANFWELAKQTCLQNNMRLAEPFEWKLSCKNAATWSLVGMTGNWEWASNFSLPMYTGSGHGVGSAIFGYSGCSYALWTWVGDGTGAEGSGVFRCAR